MNKNYKLNVTQILPLIFDSQFKLICNFNVLVIGKGEDKVN